MWIANNPIDVFWYPRFCKETKLNERRKANKTINVGVEFNNVTHH